MIRKPFYSVIVLSLICLFASSGCIPSEPCETVSNKIKQDDKEKGSELCADLAGEWSQDMMLSNDRSDTLGSWVKPSMFSSLKIDKNTIMVISHSEDIIHEFRYSIKHDTIFEINEDQKKSIWAIIDKCNSTDLMYTVPSENDSNSISIICRRAVKKDFFEEKM